MPTFVTALGDGRSAVTPARRRRDTSLLTGAPNGREMRGCIWNWSCCSTGWMGHKNTLG